MQLQFHDYWQPAPSTARLGVHVTPPPEGLNEAATTIQPPVTLANLTGIEAAVD